MWSELGVYDEYGNTITESETQHTGALPYGWLGGKERATDVSGVVLMGVRLYNSVTGQFTSVDPLVGGNSTAYAYPQDPINQYDLDGRLNWKRISGVLKKVAKVTAAAGFAACVLASAGICGAATAIGLGVSAGLNYSRWRAKEISGGTALLNFGVDFALSRLPGGRSTQLTGRHAATSLSIPGRRAIGSTARAVSRQGVHRASSLRGAATSSARTFARNTVGEWKTHPLRYAGRTGMQAGIYMNSRR